ncbi:GyrI-like domain-containing protein [Gracilibacillus alcaliphilus]|uniref:GyrI-like domain-containing protein n=1 Tax=Gracilibacillus alcaliphilus TaxID=1401441 RepID=UPI001959E736|nr:GyrI-like domain-containing protein [Gracilibacillus alcaliphilus]MBM7675597.1 putative transcriptional regulator YdeE [Gracilibacillus alcaliphilus]
MNQEKTNQQKGTQPIIQPTRIEERPSFTLAGVSAVTANEAEQAGAGKIGALFDQFFGQNIAGKLGVNIEEAGFYSCYFNYETDDTGLYEIMVSVQVDDVSSIQEGEGIQTFTVPAAKYAVFVTEKGPIIEMVQRTWAAIWEWSRQTGNQRTFTGDFEYYGKESGPTDGQVEIYIAIE